MSVRVQCPSCQTPHGVAERLLGRSIPCPNCGEPMQLPSKEIWEAAQARKLARQAKAAAMNVSPVNASGSTVAIANAPRSKPASIKAPQPAPAPTPAAEEEDPPYESPKNRDTTEMDMTPMIDVTFLLLIFFVVTASFQMQKTMEVPKSKSDTPSATSPPENPDEIDEVTVMVDSQNTYMVLRSDGEDECAGRQQLFNALREARRAIEADAPMRLIIKAHVDAKHRAVVDALDAGAEMRFTEIKLMEVQELD